MKANTRIFGEIEIADEKIITLEKGMMRCNGRDISARFMLKCFSIYRNRALSKAQ